MTSLGNIQKIEYNITNSKLKAVKALHVVAYGEEAQPRLVRKRLREFSGFGFEKNSDDYNQKICDVKEQVDAADLVSICNILNLQYEGTSDILVDRICSFLNDLQITDEVSEKDEDEEDEDEEVEEQDDDDDDQVSFVSLKGRSRTQNNNSFALTFRDIEDSIRPFSGQAEYPVEKWIADFEEIADVTGWNDLQKLVFAKKSLQGIAKLFVQSENGIKSWPMLKRKLIQEFEVKVSSAQVHKLLMSRTKKREESVQEYVLIMREIGSRANIESEVVIQCIIDGIQDHVSNKVILYGARNFSEFKEKVRLYEQMKSSKRYFEERKVDKQNGYNRNYKGNEDNSNSKIGVCYNCGEKGHKSVECPNKNKGVKCFGCNGYGHIASKCPRKNTPSTSMNVLEVVPKNGVKLEIDQIQLTALLDTGSDISALRMDVFEEHFSYVKLDKDFISIKGIGINKVATLGSFHKLVLVNDVEVSLRFHVIPSNASNFKAIVGSDILSQADLSIRDNEIVFYKKNQDNFLMHITVDEEDKCDTIDLQHKEKVKELLETYKPEKCKTTEIKMNLVLKSEEPIYQSPRRLAMPEKIIVEKQIDEWLEEGIIRRIKSAQDSDEHIKSVKKKEGKKEG